MKANSHKSFFKNMSQRFKVMLHGTIRNDYFKRNTALQCCNIIGSTGNNVATILQSCVALKVVLANRPA